MTHRPASRTLGVPPAGLARVIPVLAILALVLSCDEWTVPEPRLDPLPLGVTLDGDTLTTADLRGNVALLVFWATWCSECRQSFADLDSLWASLSPQGPFELVAIDLDTIDGQLEEYLDGQNHAFLITKGQCCVRSADFDLPGLPSYQVLDAQGFRKWTKLGYQSPTLIESVVGAELPAMAGSAGATK